MSLVMEQSWRNGAFWVPLAVMHPVAFTEMFYDCIFITFISYSGEDLNKAGYKYSTRLWKSQAGDIIERKLQE